jgi:S-adenosylmethionine:tRNA ribosyltransferase-isomerase
MHLSDLDYDLPPALIAQEPASRRDASRLMVVDRGNQTIAHHHFHHLPQWLRAGDLLVVNNTRVVPARVFGRRRGGVSIRPRPRRR